ncbi:MAG: hypothetical protein DMF81_00715 [Acidobacteria bacterium]|nr:MAG: hypothetical protein DMF81_00715 [Acidobacteriota bacterium]
MPKAKPLGGLPAATLVLIPLALMHCDKDKSENNGPAGPTGSGSLSVSIAASPTSGRAPLDVAFTSDVSGGKGSYVYSWSFGDGSASSEANPHVRFSSGGVYNVTLRVVSADEATVSAPVSVRVDGDVRLTCVIDPEEASAPATVNFRASAAGGNGQLGYLWRFGDGASSADPAPQHVYSSPGNYLATLTVTSGAASATCADTIHVFGTLVATCKATLEAGLKVKFNVAPSYCFSEHGCSYSWSFGDGETADVERPLHAYAAPGPYTAVATVTTGRTKASCSITVSP